MYTDRFFIFIASYPQLNLTLGQLWRFVPIFDPLVSEFHSRDLDSIVSQREVAAVNDWLAAENKTFHIMRDHKQHGSAIPGYFKNFLSHVLLMCVCVCLKNECSILLL